MARLAPQGSSDKDERGPSQPLVRFGEAVWYRKAYAVIRQWLEREGFIIPRPGRQAVWFAKDRGDVVPPNLAVDVREPGVITIKARPKARMMIRVYRAATNTWGEPREIDAADIRIERKE